MRKNLVISAIVAFAAFITACNQNKTSDDDKTVGTDSGYIKSDSLADVQKTSQAKKDEYNKAIKKDIDDLKEKIAERNKEMMKENNAKMKKEWTKAKDSLNLKIDRLQARLNRASDKAEDKTDEAWNKFKNDMNASMDTLKNDWDRLIKNK